jgi:hypothetical protein
MYANIDDPDPLEVHDVQQHLIEAQDRGGSVVGTVGQALRAAAAR